MDAYATRYWITPNGQFVKVLSHIDYSFEISNKKDIDGANRFMYGNGYISALNEFGTLYVSDKDLYFKNKGNVLNWTRSQKNAIRDYVEKNGIRKLKFIDSDQIHVGGVSDDHNIDDRYKLMEEVQSNSLRPMISEFYSYILKRLEIKSAPKLNLINDEKNAN